MPKHTDVIVVSPSQTAINPKRKRYTRSRTGCQDCRNRRVRCPEGKLLPNGKRQSCNHCQRGNVQCFYPQHSSDSLVTSWIPAATIDEENDWIVTGECSTNIISSGKETFQDILLFDDHIRKQRQTAERRYDSQSQSSRYSYISQPSPSITAASSADQCSDLQISHSTPKLQLWERRMLRNLLSPPIPLTPREEGLASVSEDRLDKFVIQAFESEGCKDIIAVRHTKSNWIFSLLFPRLLDLLTHSNFDNNIWQDSKLSLKKYASHAFLQMCYAHQANIQSDVKATSESMIRAAKHRSSARSIAVQLRVRYPTSFWQVEEYSMSYFMTCIADLLSSLTFQSEETAYTLSDTSSDFSKSVIRLIDVYQTLSLICTPPNFKTDYEVTIQEIFDQETLEDKQDVWVENFFGLSLSIIEIFGLMNKAVCYRIQILRAMQDSELEISEMQVKLRQLLEVIDNCESLSCSLWSMKTEAKSRRIQRGTLVALYALRTMVYSELFEADLESDDRLQELRISAIELVSDSNIEEMAGYHFMLAIVAIYIPDKEQRQQLFEIMDIARKHSFGENFKGIYHVIQQCWDEYDEIGKYKNGIAPWREIMAATGISMCI